VRTNPDRFLPPPRERERRERTGRIIGIIEIQNDPAIVYRLGVIIPAGRICFLIAGLIAELDEQRVVFGLAHFELIRLAIEFERDISIHAVFHHLTKSIRSLAIL
jgi:hypothetical protein